MSEYRAPSTSSKHQVSNNGSKCHTPPHDSVGDRARPRALYNTSSMAYSSPEGIRAQQLMPSPNDLNADVGLTYTEGMHDQQIAQVLLTYDQGGDCEALGVPHHTDRTLPMPMAGHVYLQTSSQWDGKYFRSEQKRPRIPDGMRCVPPSLTPGSNPTSPNNSHTHRHPRSHLRQLESAES